MNAASPWAGWLSEAGLRVPDPAAAATYYAELLGGTAEEDGVVLGSGTRLRLERGDPGFAWALLEIPGGNDDALHDPDGRELRVVPGDARAPLDDVEPRLGHLTFESPDPVRAQAFYEGIGFRLSEGLSDFFRWLRCNPIHHTVAFSRGPAARLHHVGVELPDRAALVSACDRLGSLGQLVEYGPGRHMVGNNLFVYFRDRYGIRFELFCELERVSPPERPPLVHEEVPRERSINLWGVQPPESFRAGI